ncbi:MAG: hypothetical protein M1816_006061 [Peltula sp. TS41687]|nr:MAG: hypothetical protein M1816_006061 [Peltula sp. TS41687]
MLAMMDVRRVKNQTDFQHFPGRIEAKHYMDCPISVEFSAQVGRKPSSTTLPLTLQEGLEPQDAPQELLLLDSEGDDLPAKLDSYIRRMADIFIQREPSSFMRETLKFASTLSRQKEDSLLSRVLELWSINHIWVDIEMKWITFEIPEAEGYGNHRKEIDNKTDEISYGLLCIQLKAAAEKRAAQISKTLLNELERRLLQRAQSGWFETYLAAICLLNCVERSTWLFQSWDFEQYMVRWPLDRKPPYFCQQSERFADMLHMLLRMRGLPPKTHESPDGILGAENDETAREYFESIRISSKTLVERQQNASFDPENSRSLELKFCARLLLPN